MAAAEVLVVVDDVDELTVVDEELVELLLEVLVVELLVDPPGQTGGPGTL